MAFGSPRDGSRRKHAGTDLYAPEGTEILAMDNGRVVIGPYPFYAGTYALEIQHPWGVVRYGEIAGTIGDLKTGDFVSVGQPIARVGKVASTKDSMLHLELYTGDCDGSLTDRSRPPYLRRADLIDPTEFLDGLKTA